MVGHSHDRKMSRPSVKSNPFRDRKRRPSVELQNPDITLHYTDWFIGILILVDYNPPQKSKITRVNWSLLSWACTKTSHQDSRHLLRCCMLLVLTTRAWWHSMGEQLNLPVCLMLWWMFGIPRGFFHLVAGELRVIQWPTFQIFQDFYPTRIGGDPSD